MFNRKNRKNHKVIQHAQFDSYAQAQDMVNAAQKRVTRIFIGMVIAAISTGLTAYAFLAKPDSAANCYFYAFLLSFPAYLIGGGLGKAIRSAWNLAVVGWFLIPFFPIDLFLGAAAFFAALLCFCFVPLVFVLINYCQNAADLREARKYMSYYKPAAEEVVA